MTNVASFDPTPPVAITNDDLVPLGRLYAALLPLEATGHFHHFGDLEVSFKRFAGERQHGMKRGYVCVSGCSEVSVTGPDGQVFLLYYHRSPNDWEEVETVSLVVWERGEWEAAILTAFGLENYDPFTGETP